MGDCNTGAGIASIIIGLILFVGLIYLWWWLDNKRDPSKPKISGWAKFGMFIGIASGLGMVTTGITTMSTTKTAKTSA